jgi:xanthine dehydrogenase accessory factor
MKGLVIVIKGAGEMASGIACRLHSAGLTKILLTEIEEPLAVRRRVSFSEAVYEGHAEVEGVGARVVKDLDEIPSLWEKRELAVLVDHESGCVKKVRPHVVIDAIMKKETTATRAGEAPLVIGIGPGFVAPRDAHLVIESNRGHDLGRIIRNGSAEPFTGFPGATMGYKTERVLRSPHRGKVRHVKQIGDAIRTGDTAVYVDDTPVFARIDGILRGLIREIHVEEGEKIGDVEPRGRVEYCHTISDKARAIGGGVLEAIMSDFNR